ncbi:hypothetical protein FOS14_21870 [Skermania sp. ID1734]|uniref:DoxX family protein n=1 Tax=Skermania sp. ID1734 TaxID=2597516 RepID=UPI00117F883B|nr:DoxX family protein [Skermania sp. ID1734]TSD93930.1 hypothetical protein FOS14_21870 [Skermania sp. ID1734]
MEVVVVALSVLLSVATIASALNKLQLDGVSWTLLRDRGYSAGFTRGFGVLEVIGVIGLMAGLFWRPFGVGAAVLLLALFAWAVRYHVDHGDMQLPELRQHAMKPIGLLVLASVTFLALLADSVF